METYTIALFGEAEKGNFHTAYYCQNLSQLVENLGNPPPDSHGLYYAVQSLLYQHSLLFFRVKEEGCNHQDYFSGLHILETQKVISCISAVFLPGVGDYEILQAVIPFCKSHHSVLIASEPDLYDYLTSTIKDHAA